VGTERLDILVTRKGLADTREAAQRLIRAGQVRVGGSTASKPGQKMSEDVDLEVKQGPRFVSRGGEKLESAFRAFDLEVSGLVCLDVGASTGGFTDCMLQHGADRVFAVDVGKGQLHWKLRNNERVTVMERVNARYLEMSDFDARPQFAAIDVSFISLTKILPPVTKIVEESGDMVTLVKPQFEAERRQVGKGGVIRDAGLRSAIVDRIAQFGMRELGLDCRGVCRSPLKGPAGNEEFLIHWKTPETSEEP